MLQHRLNKTLFIIIAATMGLLQVACKKDNSNPPVITRVRAISPAPNDSVLTKAGPGQNIVIQGSNLSTTREIYFNGYRGAFNSALLSDNSIAVTIPADMPFASLDQAKLNTIRVVTAHGEVTYTFPIVPPAPVIIAMSNEYAQAGVRVAIVGNNFFFIDKVVFPGNVEATTGITTNPSGNLLEVTIPAGITQAGPIKVVNRYGVGTSVLLFNDFVTGVMHNGDGVNRFEWGCDVSSDAALFPKGWGNYNRMTFTGVNNGDFGWWNGGRSLNTLATAQWIPTAELGGALADYALKFEIFVKEPWSAGRLYIVRNYDWTYLANFQPWKTPAGNINFTTNGGWATAVIPLTEFRTKANGLDGTGDSAPSLKTLVGNDGKGSIHFFFVNPDATAVAKWDAAIDNVRVVKLR